MLKEIIGKLLQIAATRVCEFVKRQHAERLLARYTILLRCNIAKGS